MIRLVLPLIIFTVALYILLYGVSATNRGAFLKEYLRFVRIAALIFVALLGLGLLFFSF